MNLVRALSTLILFLGINSTMCFAHESRPAYLQIVEHSADNIAVKWTRPVREQRALNIQPLFPQHCRISDKGQSYLTANQSQENWILDCDEKGIKNAEITIEGLERTISDVLVRYQRENGDTQLQVLNSDKTKFIISDVKEAHQNIKQYYFVLGVKHILSGPDHLLFVVGLLLLIPGFWALLKTITAFTFAHSITLAAATLGVLQVPSAPVEAVIALSIMFLAYEILRADQHGIGRKWPWLVAGIFGLVHGLGFAGALSEIGLPDDAIPLALFLFNLGVEVGQIMFIAVFILILTVMRKLYKQTDRFIKTAGSYGIGSIAAFWLIQRMSSF